MFGFLNRFIDWLLMREDAANADAQSPAQLTQEISDIYVLLALPEGKFETEEARNTVLQAIIAPLSAKPGLSIRPVPQTFRRTRKGSLTDQVETVVKEGHACLQSEKADLLVWGHLEPGEEAIRWYFLSAQENEANLGIPGLLENLLVPYEPEQGTLDVLYAAMFAATAPNHPSHALKIGEHLLGAVDPLTKLPAGLSPRKTSAPVRVSTMGMAAVVLSNIARRGEELGWFDPAIKAFDAWEELVDKERTPIEWALIKNHHGWLYEEMASHEDDEQAVEHIEKAINIFEDVCIVFDQNTHPLEWAAVQFRMGATCAKIGRTLSDPEYLQKSARYFKKSVEVYTQKAYPLNWADALSRMAKTLMLHGQLVKGAQSLEQAGVAFQAILKVYEEDKYPAQWASTQNNLGATLFALARRDPSTHEWVEHALVCFFNARRYYEEMDKPQMIHVIDKNIARAQNLKAQIDEDMKNDLLS